jgi:membrane protein involved in colicin uptake
VNNSLKEAGLVPPDSPFMQSSQSIDQFVKDRTTGEGTDQNLKDNIYKLTEELKTHEEAEKELKEEAETQRKAKVKRDKQIDDTARLGAGLKQNAESIQPG